MLFDWTAMFSIVTFKIVLNEAIVVIHAGIVNFQRHDILANWGVDWQEQHYVISNGPAATWDVVEGKVLLACPWKTCYITDDQCFVIYLLFLISWPYLTYLVVRPGRLTAHHQLPTESTSLITMRPTVLYSQLVTHSSLTLCCLNLKSRVFV